MLLVKGRVETLENSLEFSIFFHRSKNVGLDSWSMQMVNLKSERIIMTNLSILLKRCGKAHLNHPDYPRFRL